MISLRSIRNSTPAVLLLGLGLAMSASATNRLPSITVHAVVSKAVVGHSESGVPIQQATLKQHVSYSDLDLTTYKGVMELRKRVHSAAREACLTLDGLYPLDDPQASTCIRKAVSNASRQVESAIGRAQRIAKGP